MDNLVSWPVLDHVHFKASVSLTLLFFLFTVIIEIKLCLRDLE